MGVQQFAAISRAISLPYSTLENLKQLAPHIKVNVYFDGSLYLFRGYLSKTIRSDGTSNSRLVAQYSHDKIINMIKNLNSITINKVYIYFDGERPALKLRTIKKRQKTGTIKSNTSGATFGKEKVNKLEVQNILTDLLNPYPYIEIKHLTRGEGEHEIFLRRDRSLPSIIFTDDSDLYHISYDYEQASFNDYVFMGSTQFTFVNLFLISTHFKLPRYAFVLLMMLRGADFTNSLFTLTMVNSIIQSFRSTPNDILIQKYIQKIREIDQKYKYVEHNVQVFNQRLPPQTRNEITNDNENTNMVIMYDYIYSLEDIYKTIRYFLLILLNQEIYTRVNWNVQQKNKKFDSTIHNMFNEITCLWWSTNYSTIGVRFKEYGNNQFTYTENLSPFSFYTMIITHTYEEFTALLDKESLKKQPRQFNFSFEEFKKSKSFFADRYKDVA
ncbi:KN57_gp020 [Dikerogammarus haemobaphes nudivirus]|nr:KN57_gp020 [Dikerogammarus haemobaphes nudivirus]